MSETPPEDTEDAVEDRTGTNEELVEAAMATVSDPYKMLGKFQNANDGIGVLGYNTATTGVTKGVEGRVDSGIGYGLFTPDNAKIDGNLWSIAPFDTFVDGDRGFRLGGAGTVTSGTTVTIGGSVVGGHEGNSASGVLGGTIAGGGGETKDSVTYSAPNEVTDRFCTVAGGTGNQAGDAQSGTTSAPSATVSGGARNTARARWSNIAGGFDNTAGGDSAAIGGGDRNEAFGSSSTIGGGDGNETYGPGSTVAGGLDNRVGKSGTNKGYAATVPGGYRSVAEADFSFAAGNNAKAKSSGAFVWSDSTYTEFTSEKSGTNNSPTGSDTFHVEASGGLRLVTSLNSNGEPNAGQYLASGDSTWKTVSARSVKHDVRPVDPTAVLEGVESLTVSRWAYDTRPGVDRMGPMAGEFSDAFALGDDPETIGHVDADGVALAAIQGLSKRLDDTREDLEQKDERIADLERENEALRERLAALEDAVEHAPSTAGD